MLAKHADRVVTLFCIEDRNPHLPLEFLGEKCGDDPEVNSSAPLTK